MSFGSIRLRLTAWYLGILAVALIAFSIGSWYAMKASATHTIDEELVDRISGIRMFMEVQIAELSPREIRDEFREHSVLGPGGDLFQVCNSAGEWLYRSVILENSMVPIRLPADVGNVPIYEDLEVRGAPVRFATARVVISGQAYTVQVAAPLNEFREVLERFKVTLWLYVPLLLLVAAVGGYWISRQALRPVEQIRQAAESISIGNLSERLEVPPSKDELQQLSETLNGMLARLETSVRKLAQFTADASHELRGPVSLIRTTAELAVKDGRSNDEYREDMKQVLAEAERTTRLIESLLLLARADAREDSLHHELTDLTACAGEACDQGRILATQRGVQLTAKLGEAAIVYGDGEALRRLFFILIDNAVKYTPEAGALTVSVTTKDGQAVSTIADTGIGVAGDDLPHIFDRFWRADKVRSRSEGGAGLGLAIARWIVEQHNGTIEVASQAGKGSRFTVSVPLARVTTAAQCSQSALK